MKRNTIAICYDFDYTLSPSDMQNFGLIQSLGMDIGEFWNCCNGFCSSTNTEQVMGYMRTLLEICKQKNIKLTKDFLRSFGKQIKLFKGVESWFDRVNEYGNQHNIKIEHYIISSGQREILEGTSIA